jgi:hypothetical protein
VVARRADPCDQIHDYRDAITFIKTLPEADRSHLENRVE